MIIKVETLNGIKEHDVPDRLSNPTLTSKELEEKFEKYINITHDGKYDLDMIDRLKKKQETILADYIDGY